MNWRDPEVRRNLLVLGSWKDKRLRRRLVFAAFATFCLVIFALYWTGRPFATNPSLCGQMCHVTYGEYQSWSKSSHSEVPCHYCHLDTPMQKLVNPLVRFIKTNFDTFEKPLNPDSAFSQKHMPKERCLYCHASDAPERTRRPAPRVPSGMHGKHIKAGLQCATCHNRIAHTGAEKFEPIRTWKPGFKYPDFLKMREGCWRCHSADGKWRNEETLARVNNGRPSTECQTCHKSTWKLKPRTGKLSHVTVGDTPWRSGDRHGREALKDFYVCLGCHDRKQRAIDSMNPPNCGVSCHGGIIMPHNVPAWSKYSDGTKDERDWLEVHPAVAAREGVVKTSDGFVYDPDSVCTMCHDKDRLRGNFCNDCHHEEILATTKRSVIKLGAVWRAQHPEIVKQTGTARCQKCHVFDFCTACHTGQI